jgi:hypothetical protein
MKHPFDALNLDVLKTHFKSKNWNPLKIHTSLREYRYFLAKIQKGEFVGPSEIVDQVWHVHMLHTEKYTNDCNLLFGYYLHHVPSVGKVTKTLCTPALPSKALCTPAVASRALCTPVIAA